MKVEIKFRRGNSDDYLSVVVEGPSNEVLELVGMVRSSIQETKEWREW